MSLHLDPIAGDSLTHSLKGWCMLPFARYGSYKNYYNPVPFELQILSLPPNLLQKKVFF